MIIAIIFFLPLEEYTKYAFKKSIVDFEFQNMDMSWKRDSTLGEH